MKRLLVNAAECAGCRYCEMVCSFQKEGRFSPSYSGVTVIKEDRYGLDYPLFCRQCDNCPPADACPEGALERDGNGVVTLNEEKCIGCGICAKVCTYGAVNMGVSKPAICDLCSGEPACVERCPTKALSYEESDVYTERPDVVFLELRRRWGIDA